MCVTVLSFICVVCLIIFLCVLCLLTVRPFYVLCVLCHSVQVNVCVVCLVISVVYMWSEGSRAIRKDTRK